MPRTDHPLHRQIGDGRQRVRMQFERGRARPRAEHAHVAQEEAHELTHARRPVDVRNHFQQVIRRLRKLLAFNLDVERHMLETHRAGCDTLCAVVERAEQRVVAIDAQGRLGQLLRKTPYFTSTRNRAFVIEVHRMRVVGEAPLLIAHRDDLAAFGVVTKARRVRHANEFVMDEIVFRMQGLRHDGAQRIEIGLVGNDEVFPVDEAVRRPGVSGIVNRHRKGVFADRSEVHETPYD